MCLLSKFTDRHPCRALWWGQFNSITKVCYFALTHFTLTTRPPVFQACSLKRTSPLTEFGEMLEKGLTTVQRYLSSTVNTGISLLNRQHLLRRGRSKTRALTNSYRRTKALVLHCGKPGCKGDCCFSKASVLREGEKKRNSKIIFNTNVAVRHMHYDCLPQKSTRMKGDYTSSTKLHCWVLQVCIYTLQVLSSGAWLY